jgi:hypothetical protein
MPFTLDSFARSRPYLYHLTDERNLARIRRTGILESAERIFIAGGREDLLGTRRRVHERVQVYGETVHVRDQAPLHGGNIALGPHFEFSDFVRLLNARIFFWPGTERGPIAYGMRHFERYAHEGPVILRTPTASLIGANPQTDFLFCKFNSGSPRCNQGRPSPRTPSTFVSAAEAPFTISEVVEATVIGTVHLPPDSEFGNHTGGPWLQLLSRA